jgi:hypothetical protein
MSPTKVSLGETEKTHCVYRDFLAILLFLAKT